MRRDLKIPEWQLVYNEFTTIVKMQGHLKSMTAKEQLIQEIEQAPDLLIIQLLDFCLFLKDRQHIDGAGQPQQLSIANLSISPTPHQEQQMAATSEPEPTSLLELVAQIHAQVPLGEWDKLPRDLSINYDHYLYGSPKVEE
jgi:hypothetical protein